MSDGPLAGEHIDVAWQRIPSHGPAFLYVLPCAYEDLLKLGFSRDPLARLQAFSPRWFEMFDLDRALLVETETVRDARVLELRLRRALAVHNAPAPLLARDEAGGRTEWYRGAYATLADEVVRLGAHGHDVHAPARPWLRERMRERQELLHAWTHAMLDVDELESTRAPFTPAQRAVRDALDACVALDLDPEPCLPDAVRDWYRAVAARPG